MADQNRYKQSQDESNDMLRDEQDTDETQRERSIPEPVSTADDRGVSDELESESEVDELGDESSSEDEDISSR